MDVDGFDITNCNRVKAKNFTLFLFYLYFFIFSGLIYKILNLIKI